MNSHKGISPIIASVLIILVVISLASTYTVWSSRVFGSVASAGEETVSKTSRALFSNFDIQSAADTRIFIKNTGTSELSASALQVFYDNEPIDFTADFDVLAKDGLGTLTLTNPSTLALGDHSLRITAGSFSDSAKVTLSTPPGLMASWSFEEGTGNTTKDSSGNGNDGTLINGTSWTKGKVGGGVSFDGVNDYVRVPDATSLMPSNAITVEAWVKPTETITATRDIISKYSNGASGYLMYQAGVGGTVAGFDIPGAGSGGAAAPEGIFTANIWFHLVGTYNRQNVTLYVDGVLKSSKGSTGVSIISNTRPVLIGARSDLDNDGQLFFKGVIDEVRIYDTTYTPDKLYVLKLKS